MLMRQCIQIPDIHVTSGAQPCVLAIPALGSWDRQRSWELAGSHPNGNCELLLQWETLYQGNKAEIKRGKKPYILLWVHPRVHPRVHGLMKSLAHLHTSYTTYEESHTKQTTIPCLQFFRNITTPSNIPTSVYRDTKLISKGSPFVLDRCKESWIILKSSLNWKDQHDGILALRSPRWEEDKLKTRLGCIARPCLDNNHTDSRE